MRVYAFLAFFKFVLIFFLYDNVYFVQLLVHFELISFYTCGVMTLVLYVVYASLVVSYKYCVKNRKHLNYLTFFYRILTALRGYHRLLCTNDICGFFFYDLKNRTRKTFLGIPRVLSQHISTNSVLNERDDAQLYQLKYSSSRPFNHSCP